MNSRRQPYNLVFVFLLLSITSVIEVDRDRHLLRTSPKTVDVAAVLLREERGVRHCAPEGLISWSVNHKASGHDSPAKALSSLLVGADGGDDGAVGDGYRGWGRGHQP